MSFGKERKKNSDLPWRQPAAWQHSLEPSTVARAAWEWSITKAIQSPESPPLLQNRGSRSCEQCHTGHCFTEVHTAKKNEEWFSEGFLLGLNTPNMQPHSPTVNGETSSSFASSCCLFFSDNLASIFGHWSIILVCLVMISEDYLYINDQKWHCSALINGHLGHISPFCNHFVLSCTEKLK